MHLFVVFNNYSTFRWTTACVLRLNLFKRKRRLYDDDDDDDDDDVSLPLKT